jgi:cyclohexyl-isocyanide hydratase
MPRFLNGFSFQATKGFSDASSYDAIWLPGGDPVRVYLDFLIHETVAVKYVCSVCEGALPLAAASLLDGYEATTHRGSIPCLKERFKNVKVADGYPRFVHDRNRLTGGRISSGLDEALKLIKLLLGQEKAEYVQRMTQYYPKPPVSSEITPATDCPVPLVIIPPPH